MSTERPDLSADRTHVLEDVEIALSYNPSPEMNFEDVAEVMRGAVYNSRDYGGDGDDLVAIVRLRSGGFAALEGWADYTGWDCGSGLEITFHDTPEDAWRYGIGTDSRALVERAEADA